MSTFHHGPPRPLRVIIFSLPRTGSNLFCQLFSEHPAFSNLLYPLLISYCYGPEAQTQMTGKRMDELRDRHKTDVPSYQLVLDIMQNHTAVSEAKGKIPLFKEHGPYVVRSDVVQKMLSRHREVAQEPRMVDNMLDVQMQKRSEIPRFDESPNRNPTIYPDRFLQSLAPVITIRHPAKQVPSWYKASRHYDIAVEHPDFELCASYKVLRRMFDYFKDLYEIGVEDDITASGEAVNWPIVIDGDDLIDDAERITRKFCNLTGVDPGGIIFSWEEMEPEHQDKMFFWGTLFKSSGVIKDLKPKEALDIAECSKQWTDAWGEDVATALVHYARDAMVDYEYLHQFRLRA